MTDCITRQRYPAENAPTFHIAFSQHPTAPAANFPERALNQRRSENNLQKRWSCLDTPSTVSNFRRC
jgi:hypothetical protein